MGTGQMHATHRVSTTEHKHMRGQRDKQVPSRWHTRRRPHLSVGALKRPAEKAALICMIDCSLLKVHHINLLCRPTNTLHCFYHTEYTIEEPKGDTLSLYEILCAP